METLVKNKSNLKVTLSDRDNASPEAFDRILKIFKRKTMKSGILRELKQKRYFEKPSAKKRRIRKENARKRNKKGRKK